MGVSPEKAIKLTANDTMRDLLTSKEGHLPIYREMIAGGSVSRDHDGLKSVQVDLRLCYVLIDFLKNSFTITICMAIWVWTTRILIFNSKLAETCTDIGDFAFAKFALSVKAYSELEPNISLGCENKGLYSLSAMPPSSAYPPRLFLAIVHYPPVSAVWIYILHEVARLGVL